MLCLPLLLEYASKQERMFSWKDAAMAPQKYSQSVRCTTRHRAVPIHLLWCFVIFLIIGHDIGLPVFSHVYLVFMLSSKHKSGLLQMDCFERIVANGFWRWGFARVLFSHCFPSKQELCTPGVMQRYMGLLEHVAKDKRQKVATK